MRFEALVKRLEDHDQAIGHLKKENKAEFDGVHKKLKGLYNWLDEILKNLEANWQPKSSVI